MTSKVCVFNNVTYLLGCVRTFGDSVLVASDQSMLQFDENLNLQSIIPTNRQPYCILPALADDTVLLLGRGEDVNKLTLSDKDKADETKCLLDDDI